MLPIPTLNVQRPLPGITYPTSDVQEVLYTRVCLPSPVSLTALLHTSHGPTLDVDVRQQTPMRNEPTFLPDNTYTTSPTSHARIPIIYPTTTPGTHNTQMHPDDVARFVRLEHASAWLALKDVDKLLKSVKNRRMMLRTASVVEMDRFKGCCEAMLKMVEVRCRGAGASQMMRSVPVAEVVALPREEMDQVVGAWRDDGWSCVKRAHTLLNEQRHRTTFLKTSTV
ncbi:hypothetical protein MJO28_015049, partial [Puccinia striiformis f. sp. tritici]